MQKTLNASINLNNTVIKRIQDAISRQIELTDLSSGFLDINKVGHVKAILQNLTSVKSAQILYGLQPTVNNLTQGVNSQIGNLLTQMNTLSDKFKSLDTPLGGSIPVSFNVLLAVFPLALSIVFCYLAMTLRDTIRLRRVLETGTNQNAKDFVSESPLWIDPKPPKEYK